MAVTYTPDLLARAQAWLTLSTNAKRQPAGLQELADLWAAFQGRAAGTCRQCQFSDYQRDVVAYVRESSRLQNPTTMSDTNSTYQIAPAFANESFVHDDWNGPVTAANLTDEAAEFFISKGRDDAFVKVGSKAAQAAEPEAEQEPGDTRDYAEELATEQANHAATKGELEREAATHATTAQDLKELRATHKTDAAALKAEKQAHEATAQDLKELRATHKTDAAALKAEKQAHEATAQDLKELRATHKTDAAALKAEKQAHEATAKERDELNEQVTDLTQKLAEATAKKAK